MDIFVHSDVLPGAGLGGSSSVVVALIGVLAYWKKLKLNNYDIAELAYRIERKEAGIKGGRQDQYASAFGGLNFIQFFGDKTIVNPIQLGQNVLNELQYRLMLCDTGKRRISAGIIEDQIKCYQEKKEDTVNALNKTKSLAIDMRNALSRGNVGEIGILLNEGWLAKKKILSKITNNYIYKLYNVAMNNGALGGKLLGAGGGGYLLFLCQFDKWHKVAHELERNGEK
jgi:D-glycero-alpha-D-manno-heptose-7-phosphate kinase